MPYSLFLLPFSYGLIWHFCLISPISLISNKNPKQPPRTGLEALQQDHCLNSLILFVPINSYNNKKDKSAGLTL